MPSFQFEKEQFNKLFPFYIIINNQLIIEDAGVSLLKLFPTIINNHFHEIFTVKKPREQIQSFEEILENSNHAFFIHTKWKKRDLLLRGEFITIKKTLLFTGVPWVVSLDELANYNLSETDFAIHDTSIDLYKIIQL